MTVAQEIAHDSFVREGCINEMFLSLCITRAHVVEIKPNDLHTKRFQFGDHSAIVISGRTWYHESLSYKFEKAPSTAKAK